MIISATPIFFCSDQCLDKFKENPEKFRFGTKKGEQSGSNKAKGNQDKSDGVNDSVEQQYLHYTKYIYTCPMHPEIEQEGPDSCPKCGMALEPRDIFLEQDEENSEYKYMRKRFIWGAILTVPLVVIAMREILPGGHLIDKLASVRTLGWIELILATPVIVWAGWSFYVNCGDVVLSR